VTIFLMVVFLTMYKMGGREVWSFFVVAEMAPVVSYLGKVVRSSFIYFLFIFYLFFLLFCPPKGAGRGPSGPIPTI